jgi:hypothetical protein
MPDRKRVAAVAGNQGNAISRCTASSMKRKSNSEFTRRLTPLGFGLALGLVVWVGLQLRPGPTSGISHATTAGDRASFTAPLARSIAANPFEVTSYFLNFAGDHSLELATVVEQASAGYAKYTVELQLASGAEQSVVVDAPPGGLQIEMQDMTGDHVPNDVILRPALVQGLPTVLVNDGHEHFRVASSATDPKLFSSSEDIGSRGRNPQMFAILMSSGFKTSHSSTSRGLFDSQLQEHPFYFSAETVATRLDHSASPGRAPPFLTAV